MKNFVSCHVHQASLDTASTPEAFAKKELELGTGYLVNTDHGTLGAARKIYDLAKKKKLSPIIGLEAYLRDDDCPILKSFGVTPQHPENDKGELQLDQPKTLAHYAKYFHLTMHFMDADAYELGVRILSKADARAEKHGSERKPLFTWADLEELGGHNVTMTSSCLVGVVQRHLLDHDNLEIATAYYEKIRGICKPGNFYVETFPHRCDKNWDSAGYLQYSDGSRERLKPWKKLKFKDGEEAQLKDFAKRWKPGMQDQLLAVMENRKWQDREPKLVTGVELFEDFIANECRPWAEDGDVQKGANIALLYLAQKYGDQVLIGDDSHYAQTDEKVVQDIRLQAGGGSWRFYGHYHRQSSAQALQHFQETLGVEQREFDSWVDNSYAWAERFKGFKFKDRKSIPASFYPEDTLAHTMALIEKHGRMRWEDPVWVERLSREIEMLHENGKVDLLPYFMIDEEVCDLYGRNGKLTGPGRGSAAGMLLAYLLRITHVDPIANKLSMERFLTASRVRSGKLPDIDQDLPDRELLVGFLYDGWELKLSNGETVSVKAGSKAFHSHEGGPAGYELTVEDAAKQKTPVTEFYDLGRRFDAPVTILEMKKVEQKEPGFLDKRFGDCYAAISTDVSLKLRSAVKDVARVMHDGQIPQDVEFLTRKFPNAPQGISDYDFVFGYKGSDGWVEGILTQDPALIEYTNKYPREWEIVQKCLGLTRQKSKHACAYVIADEPISNFIPLTRVGADLVTVTQYTAPSVEAVGGLKMDFLVINSLRDIAACINLVQERCGWQKCQLRKHASEQEAQTCSACMSFGDMVLNGEKVLAHEIVPFKGEFFSVWKLPQDQAVYRDFCEGKTETVFQFNTPGAVGWLKNFDRVKETRPDGEVVKALDSIEALSAFTALDRPGPLDFFVEATNGDRHNMLVEFARRSAGEPPIGEIEALTKILPETYGVIVYQEQLQAIFHALGKTTLEEADEFRIHISKKQAEKVIADKAVFMRGAVESVGQEDAQKIWESMETFAAYGFNKSHSTAYVTISYACAFLKHHYPLEWWTAVLRHADKDEISSKFWVHCGHLIDLPDVALSGQNFEIVNERIRAPLSILLGVGEGAHKQLMTYRPYTNLEDFCQKIIRHQVDNTTKVMKTVKVKKPALDAEGNALYTGDKEPVFVEVDELVEKDKKGHNSLNKGVIATLIVSGAMDSFFPKGTLVMDAMDEYVRTMVKVKGKKTITKADKFDQKYASLNGFAKYQMRKAVLPAYVEPCLPMVLRSGHPGVIDGQEADQRPEFRIEGRRAPFVFLDEIEFLGSRKPWPEDYSITVSAAGYVVEARKFNYGDGKSREAMELILDIDGGQMKAVKWGGKTGKLPDHIRDAAKLKGSIAVAQYTKYNEDRPFVVEDLEVIQPPLDQTKESSPDSE
jgi:DNA polymerase III alpha subunit